jgi:PST family polysaccharide transporter
MAFIWVTLANAVLVGLGMVAILALRGINLRGLRMRFGRAREMLRDSWPLMLAGLAAAVYMKIDINAE